MCRKTWKEDLSTNSCHYLTNKKIPETYIKRYHFFVSGIRYVERVNLFSVLIEEVHHLLQILLAVHINPCPPSGTMTHSHCAPAYYKAAHIVFNPLYPWNYY